eukprot:TRINITY_DN1996_c0_g1_i1.p1 TRINITY_DN1996_c0_g1~~TRINITY_DN1996_c0_g1_i1.p1  ORF type:complete len:314 (-),score=64.18 TRINITY_DN1996_c0_g1_i1:231-1172(-)
MHQLDYCFFFSAAPFSDTSFRSDPILDYAPSVDIQSDCMEDSYFSAARCRGDDWSWEAPLEFEGPDSKQLRVPESIDCIFDWNCSSESYWREKDDVKGPTKKRRLVTQYPWTENEEPIIEELKSITPLMSKPYYQTETKDLYITSEKHETDFVDLAGAGERMEELEGRKGESGLGSEEVIEECDTENAVSEAERSQHSLEKKKCCNCKNSKCLKLYCECFASQGYCSGCNCTDCHNMPEYRKEISENIRKIRKKNPVGLMRSQGRKEVSIGCNCKKSECRRNYCYCYKNNKKCGDNCKCTQCKNCSHEQSTKQ